MRGYERNHPRPVSPERGWDFWNRFGSVRGRARLHRRAGWALSTFFSRSCRCFRRARAFENGVYVIYTSPRNAFVADPDGDIISQVRSHEDGLMFAKIVLDGRIGDRHAFQVRHPELYGRLTDQPKQ